MLSDEELEIALAESPGNKVTEEYIKSRIKSINYHLDPHDKCCTICTILLDNGFTVRGESACVDPRNFVKAKGEEIAYNNAFEKLWMPFGFLLTESIYRFKLSGA